MSQADSETDVKFDNLPVDKLDVWTDVNVRKQDIEINIEELASNIKEIGVQVPLLVKPKAGGRFWVISGQRRLLAAKRAGKTTVPCLIRNDISILDARIASFSENIYRLDMTDEDKADAATLLLERLKTHEAVAEKLGVSVQTVKHYLGFKNVAEPIKKYVRQHKMNSRTAVKIHQKFKDPRAAAEIAKTYAEAPQNVKQKMYEAINEASPTSSPEDVKESARKKGDLIPYKISLPPATSEIIKDLSQQSSQPPELIIAQIVEQWIDSFKQGTVRL